MTPNKRHSTTTVVIPVYNRAKIIGRTIESALAQTRSPDEIVIVDDCSTDSTREVLLHWHERDERIKPVFRKTNGGPAGARNAGVDAANGDLIAFLDSDDTWLPNHLERCVGLLEADAALDLAFSDVRRVTVSGRILHESFLSGHKAILRYLAPHATQAGCYRFRETESTILFRDYVVPVQTTVIRTALARSFRFDERLRGPEDYQLALRLARAGKKFGYVDQVLAECLLHDTNLVGDESDLRMCGEDIKLWSGFLSDAPAQRPERVICHEHLSRLRHDKGYALMCRGQNGPAVREYVRSLWHRPNSRAARGLARAAFAWLASNRQKEDTR